MLLAQMHPPAVVAPRAPVQPATIISSSIMMKLLACGALAAAALLNAGKLVEVVHAHAWPAPASAAGPAETTRPTLGALGVRAHNSYAELQGAEVQGAAAAAAAKFEANWQLLPGGTPKFRAPTEFSNCNQQSDCPAGEYCDSTQSCYACTYITPDRCDAENRSTGRPPNCCSQEFLEHCRTDPFHCNRPPGQPRVVQTGCTSHGDCKCGAICVVPPSPPPSPPPPPGPRPPPSPPARPIGSCQLCADAVSHITVGGANHGEAQSTQGCPSIDGDCCSGAVLERCPIFSKVSNCPDSVNDCNPSAATAAGYAARFRMSGVGHGVVFGQHPGNGFLDGPTVEGFFVFDPAHNRSQLVLDGTRGHTIPGMVDWLGGFQSEGGTYSDTNLKLLFDGQFPRTFRFLVSTPSGARSPSTVLLPEWIKPPVSDCSQAFPNGSIAGSGVDTPPDAPPHESCATTPSDDCCERSMFLTAPSDLLLGIPGSPTSGISKYGNSLLSAFLPDAEDELGSTLKDLGLSFSRRDTLGVMGSGVSMSMDRWTRRNDCRNVPNSPLL